MPLFSPSAPSPLSQEEVGTGEPLLLISGSGRDHTDWNEVRDDFAGWYRVIIYDHRGTGQSDKPEVPPYTTREFARDAIWLLDHLGIERTHVYGLEVAILTVGVG